MITSRRDYILRIIDEVGRLLARAIFKRRGGAPDEALQTIVQACESLFGLEADKLFQFTPDQHFAMLANGEPPDIARDKILLYAALNTEAGQVYAKLGNKALARGSFLNALRLVARVRNEFSADGWPAHAPSITVLRELLADEPLDAATLELLGR